MQVRVVGTFPLRIYIALKMNMEWGWEMWVLSIPLTCPDASHCVYRRKDAGAFLIDTGIAT